MQDTAPASDHATATNSIRIPSPKMNKPFKAIVISNTSCDTKEVNQAKENDSSEDNKCKDNQENCQRLSKKKGSDSEAATEETCRSNVQESKDDTQYTCPICDTILFSSHDFTIHIRSHNNILPEEFSLIAAGKGFVCRVCSKVLASASSLDRHSLVHSGERPFHCKVCGISFTTNGNMHRHMRSHSLEHGDSSFNYDSDASAESLGSPKSLTSSPALNLRRGIPRTSEFNNNTVQIAPSSTNGGSKRKSDSDDVNSIRKRNKGYFTERFDCSYCDKSGFLSLNLLETHIEECHPGYKAKCVPCNLIFKNHRVLNLHRSMSHHSEIKNHPKTNIKQETVGFKDLTFVDFSSEKFPHIARAMCEQNLHLANSLYHRFQCDNCGRAFPCGSALNIHRQGCGQENYASSGESCHQEHDLSSSDNDAPTDLSSGDKIRSWGPSKVCESSDEAEDERRRCNFFAGLDLQNKSLTNTPTTEHSLLNDRLRRNSCFNPSNPEGRDLADIQSIISVASTGGLLHDLSKSPQPTVLEVTPPDSGSRSGLYDSGITDEEQQDCFASEFRKMKLRGEFPCRLCSAIFPNLRALKGHNRVHLSSNGGQNSAPYRCNMCPHFSTDKSALIRHMRTHNGDRPYECALCHYAFTTKANCERHLRNRHAKMTREEVKKSIIYHPSEDPTNEIEHKPSRDDVKRSLFCEKEISKTVEAKDIIKTEIIPIVCKNILETDHGSSIIDAIPLQKPSAFPQVKKIAFVSDDINDFTQRKCSDVGTMTYQDSDSGRNAPMLVGNVSSSKIEMDLDSPLDLSMDVLDLSKKKKIDYSSPTLNVEEQSNYEEDAEPQDLSKKPVSDIQTNSDLHNVETTDRCQLRVASFSRELNTSTPSPHPSTDRESPVPPVSVTTPKLDLSKLYSTNAHPFFLNNNSTFPPFTSASAHYPPYFIPPPPVLFSPNASHELVEMKERLQKELIRGLQLTSGGSLVLDQIAMANAADRIQALHQQAMAEFNWRMENCKDERKVYSPSLVNDVKQVNNDDAEKEVRNQQLNQPVIPKLKHESTSVKMVIKNGVLIPKQKQRRYRTERPFSCEHCSARFTLRSNMERHIKQQHPQFWTQRQRNATSLPTRRNHSLPPKIPQSLLNHGQYYPNSDTSVYNIKSEDDNLSRSSTEHVNIEKRCHNSVEGRACISEEVKNAIAHQLKSKIPPANTPINEDDNGDDLMDEEEDEDLVIDEEVNDEESYQMSNEKKLEEEIMLRKKIAMKEENLDLASVSRLLDNASTQTFRQYFHSDEDHAGGEASEEDEEGLVAAGSTSEGCNSGSDENRSESEVNNGTNSAVVKKKSAYSLAPNRVSCPYCFRKFPWSSSLRRHVLTHTGQKPYKCSFCPLLFTTKSNCDRHLLRKHGGGAPSITPETQAPTTADPSGNNSTNYTMRNVPERPYKCKSCPSSTFSTLSNLKKHLSNKHSSSGSGRNEGTQSGYESQESVSEEIDTVENEPATNENDGEKRVITDLREIHPGHSEIIHHLKPHNIPSEQSFVAAQPSDLPFKCHLCEGSFAERQEALDHIRNSHCAEFQLLMSKGALEAGATVEDPQAPDDGGEENLEQLRGKFPDYANRKVMCAFCLRRFWSAEDLRRHMRTHTGERPFSCDICRRRFTLKHSMLRHRKKHSVPPGSAPEEASPASDDDNGTSSSTTNHNNNTILSAKPWIKSRVEEETDLISNLLGIQDKTIVDKMLLSKSADDAAKLLGVQNK